MRSASDRRRIDFSKQFKLDFSTDPDSIGTSQTMFTPRICQTTTLHSQRERDVFSQLHQEGQARQERKIRASSPNAFVELQKMWRGFGQYTNWADVSPRSMSRTTNKCPWKKRAHELEVDSRHHSTPRRQASSPAVRHTVASLEKILPPKGDFEEPRVIHPISLASRLLHPTAASKLQQNNKKKSPKINLAADKKRIFASRSAELQPSPIPSAVPCSPAEVPSTVTEQRDEEIFVVVGGDEEL